MKAIVCALLIIASSILVPARGFAADTAPTSFQMPLQDKNAPATRTVRLLIDIAPDEAKEFGISVASMTTDITNRLLVAQIHVQSGEHLPQLAIRIQCIPAGDLMACYAQMTFYEEAQLLRNRSMIMALTWSRANLISCEKQDVAKEIDTTITDMINAFILDYQKALS